MAGVMVQKTNLLSLFMKAGTHLLPYILSPFACFHAIITFYRWGDWHLKQNYTKVIEVFQRCQHIPNRSSFAKI